MKYKLSCKSCLFVEIFRFFQSSALVGLMMKVVRLDKSLSVLPQDFSEAYCILNTNITNVPTTQIPPQWVLFTCKCDGNTMIVTYRLRTMNWLCIWTWYLYIYGLYYIGLEIYNYLYNKWVLTFHEWKTQKKIFFEERHCISAYYLML